MADYYVGGLAPSPTLYPRTTLYPTAPRLTTPARTELPHFAHPFVLTKGKAATVEQDTPEHILACETRIVLTPLGARSERPEFGWRWPLFRSVPLDLSELERALREFEPRGRASASELLAAADPSIPQISVDVEV